MDVRLNSAASISQPKPLIALADSRFHKFFFWIAMSTCFGFMGCARDDYHSRSFVAGESTLFIALDLPNELDTFQTWVD
jgi:hypothetical protein